MPRVIAAAFVVLLIAAVVVAVRGGPDRIGTAAELRERLHGLESQDRVRELLGEPTASEKRPHAEVWDYVTPFENVTRIRVVFGERRRVAWYSWSATSKPPSLRGEDTPG